MDVEGKNALSRLNDKSKGLRIGAGIESLRNRNEVRMTRMERSSGD